MVGGLRACRDAGAAPLPGCRPARGLLGLDLRVPLLLARPASRPRCRRGASSRRSTAAPGPGRARPRRWRRSSLTKSASPCTNSVAAGRRELGARTASTSAVAGAAVPAVQPDELGAGGERQSAAPRRGRRPRRSASTRAPAGSAVQRGGDRRQRALVAGQQVPVGVRVGRVGAARPHEPDHGRRAAPTPPTARPRPRRRGATKSMVSSPAVGVPGAHGVGAGHRPLLAGQLASRIALQVERLGIGRARRREQQLDVVVGELAGREVGQAVAAEHDPDHVRRDPLGAQHLGHPRRAPAGRAAALCCLGHAPSVDGRS